MESTLPASSSCWCCAECTQSRLDRHSAAAAAVQDGDDVGDAGVERAVCDGLVERCDVHGLSVDDEPDVNSCEDVFADHLVCIDVITD